MPVGAAGCGTRLEIDGEKMERTPRKIRFGWRAVVAGGLVAAAVGLGGCEYLGLSGGGGADQKSGDQKQKADKGSQPKQKKGGSADKKKAKKKAPEPKKAKKKERNQEGTREGGEADAGGTPAPPTLSGTPEGDGQEEEEATERSPFAPGVQTETEDESSEEKSAENLPPMQRRPYAEYQLMAIIREVSVPKAMFKGPDGVGHLLKEGDKIGRNGNVIKDIRSNAVELEIPPEGDEGTTRSEVLKLRKARGAAAEADEGLSEEESETLQKLMESEEGREELRKQIRNQSGEGSDEGMAPPE